MWKSLFEAKVNSPITFQFQNTKILLRSIISSDFSSNRFAQRKFLNGIGCKITHGYLDWTIQVVGLKRSQVSGCIHLNLPPLCKLYRECNYNSNVLAVVKVLRCT